LHRRAEKRDQGKKACVWDEKIIGDVKLNVKYAVWGQVLKKK
jgi:hypothetical protein